MKKVFKFIFGNKILATIFELIIAGLLFLLIAVLLKRFLPAQGGDFFANVFGEVPILGNIINFAYNFFHSNSGVVFSMSTPYHLIQYIGESALNTFVVAYCLLVFNQIHTLIGFNGCKAIFAILGCGFGALTLEIFKASPWYYNLLAIAFFIILLIVLMIITQSVKRKNMAGLYLAPKRTFWAIFLRIMFAGYQALAAGWCLYTASCIFIAHDYGLKSFKDTLAYIIIPMVIWAVILGVQELIDTLIDKVIMGIKN